jgi:hypothetical protein
MKQSSCTYTCLYLIFLNDLPSKKSGMCHPQGVHGAQVKNHWLEGYLQKKNISCRPIINHFATSNQMIETNSL